MQPDEPTPPATLRIVRTAVSMGPVVFGVLAWYLRGQRAEHPRTPEELSGLRVAAYASLLAVAAGLMVIRSQRAGKPPHERSTYNIMGWAIAEMGALLGAVYYFLGGEPAPLLLGLVAMLGSWALLPVDPNET